METGRHMLTPFSFEEQNSTASSQNEKPKGRGDHGKGGPGTSAEQGFWPFQDMDGRFQIIFSTSLLAGELQLSLDYSNCTFI